MEQQNFGFVGSEESTRTGVLAKTKSKVLRRCRDKLVPVFTAWFLAHVVEAVPIVGTAVIIDDAIFHHCVRRHGNRCTLGDYSTVRKGNLLGGVAVQASCVQC